MSAQNIQNLSTNLFHVLTRLHGVFFPSESAVPNSLKLYGLWFAQTIVHVYSAGDIL